MAIVRHNNLLQKVDLPLLGIAMLIFLVGLLSLYSSSYSTNPTLLMRQLIWGAIGIIALFMVVNIKFNKIIGFIYLLYSLTILVLIAVLILGEAKLGAQRWLNLGPLNFQPSEFAKIVVILTLARYLGEKASYYYLTSEEWKRLFVSISLVLVPLLLILKEPDLGTAISLLPILFVMLYIARINVKYLFLTLGIGVISSPIFWHFLKDYQKERLLVFINPNIDPLGVGYTMIQSKIAIGSGRLLGKGWLSGTQNQLNFLPERHTDFIFSVIGEEWGFLGSVIVVFLYFFLIRRCLNIASQMEDLFSRLVCYGIVIMLSFQIIVNIAMTIGLMPVVGLPLPLMSYGGSSIVVTFIALGILMNLRTR
jgi:rod shape determining protein RodA